MIKVKVKSKKAVDGNEYDSFNYTCNATLDLSNDACVIEALKMFEHALIVEGYHISSIANGMYNYAKHLAFENNIELKDDDE